MIAGGMVKRIAEKYSVFQSDVARFESAIREALQEYAASEWVDVRTELPDEGMLVLIFTSRFNCYLAKRRGEYFEFHLGGKLHVWEIATEEPTFDYETATKWTEAPQAPAGTGEEAERG